MHIESPVLFPSIRFLLVNITLKYLTLIPGEGVEKLQSCDECTQ